VLIVEDDPVFRKLLTEYLNDHGLAADSAGSGGEALWMIARQKPDLVILDLSMPEMPGEHVCRLIKSDPALSDIIVFVLSGREDLQTKLNCLKIGAEEYLLKPIDLQELCIRIERFLSFADRVRTPQQSDERTMTLPLEKPAAVPKAETTPITTVPLKPASQPPEKSHYGSYRVERLVGKGGMGHVYKAYDEQLDRFIALKVLSRQWTDSAEFVARFRREAKLIAALNHSGIAQIYSLGQDLDEYYFALLWCPGGSVRDLIRNQQTIGLMKAIDIILQCSRALAAAWQRGVVHRDVKPSNIMFDENQQIKLVDFGIAHSEKTSAHQTLAQEILGSPAYMAPEQARAERVDQRTDIYALGMTFFQMLTGELPFSARSPVEWMVKHSTEPFPSYQEIKPRIHKKAYNIIERMTRKIPAERYETYDDLITDLETLQTELFRERQFKVPSALNVARVPSVQGDQLFEVLVRVLKNAHSGILVTQWGPLEKKFFISQGDAVLFESPQSEENVWKALIEQGYLDPAQVFTNNPNLEELLNRLLFLQVLSLDDFVVCYRKLMQRALLEVFRWPVADIRFYRAEIAEDVFCKVPLRTLLMEAARNVLDYDSIRTRVPHEQFIVRTPQFDQLFSMVELPAAESFLASRIEGEAVTLEILQLLTGFPVEYITRFIYALKSFDAIDFKSPSRRRQRQRDPLWNESFPVEGNPGSTNEKDKNKAST
jgi:serine/threonine protein kinase/CheY-like chemotaxis protein